MIAGGPQVFVEHSPPSSNVVHRQHLFHTSWTPVAYHNVRIMEISSRDTFMTPRSSQKRHASSPSPPSARTTLRLHSHSRSLDLQHDTALRSSKASSSFPTPEPLINRSNKTSRIMSSVRKSLFSSHLTTQNSKKQSPVDSVSIPDVSP